MGKKTYYRVRWTARGVSRSLKLTSDEFTDLCGRGVATRRDSHTLVMHKGYEVKQDKDTRALSFYNAETPEPGVRIKTSWASLLLRVYVYAGDTMSARQRATIFALLLPNRLPSW